MGASACGRGQGRHWPQAAAQRARVVVVVMIVACGAAQCSTAKTTNSAQHMRAPLSGAAAVHTGAWLAQAHWSGVHAPFTPRKSRAPHHRARQRCCRLP